MFSLHRFLFTHVRHSFAVPLTAVLLLLSMVTATVPAPALAAVTSTVIDRAALLQQLLAQLLNLQQQLAQLQAKEATGCFVPTRNLAYGMVGSDVAILQRIFAQSPSTYGTVAVTGLFDLATQRAVERFQANQNIVRSGSPATTGYGAVGPRTIAAFSTHCYDPRGISVNDDDENDNSDSIEISDLDLDTTSWNLVNDDTNELTFTVQNDTDESESVSYTIEVTADNSGHDEPNEIHGSFTLDAGDDHAISKNFSADDFDYGEYTVSVTIKAGSESDTDTLDFRTIESGDDDIALEGVTFDTSWNKSEVDDNPISFEISNSFADDVTVDYEVRVYRDDNDDEILTESDDVLVRDGTSNGEEVTVNLDSSDFDADTYRVEVEIDPSDSIDETDEDNNLITRTLTVTDEDSAPQKPNIVYIMVDDMDKGLLTELPKLRAAMINKGMVLDNYFVSLSLCCPSRSTILTGDYAHNTGVFTNARQNADGTSGGYYAFTKPSNTNKTIGVQLQNAGYQTAFIGKYLNGYSENEGVSYSTIPPGWSTWVSPLGGNPYAEYNYTLNVNGTPEEHYLPNCTKGQPVKCAQNALANNYSSKDAHYLSHVIREKAVDFIETNAADNKPFFLYLTPYAPHGPNVPAPEYENLLTNQSWLASHTIKKTAAFNEVDISDKPSWMQSKTSLTAGDIATMNKNYQKRLVSMYGIEDMVNTLITTLTETGQLDNTYIIFTSDNGFHIGEHRLRAGKLTQFDTDLKVPMIVRGPGITAGSKSTKLTGNIDIAPTIAELAGITVPSNVDGRSFAPLLLGKSMTSRQAFLIEHANPEKVAVFQGTPDEPGDDQVDYPGKYIGVRTPQYTYVRYDRNGEEELYDNVADPLQLTNIASTTSSSLLGTLRSWATDLSTCAGATCRTIDAQSRIK